jgi:hypothetical protein
MKTVNTIMKNSIMTKTLIGALLLSANLQAATIATEPESSSLAYEQILSRNEANDSVTAETTDLLGERIDLNSGSISFKHTDVSLPGNSALPVAISRLHKSKAYSNFNRTDFSDWALDIPYIQTTTIQINEMAGPWGLSPARECSGELEQSAELVDGYRFDSNDFYNGETIHIPGKINEKLLARAVDGFVKKTKSNYGVKCESNAAGTGEIFKVHAPDGTVYTFAQPYCIFSRMLITCSHRT